MDAFFFEETSMPIYTNQTNIPLSVAAWLANDTYDGNPTNQKMISVTTLLKSTRQIILNDRMQGNAKTLDVSELFNSALGKAFHDAVEATWKLPKEKLDAILLSLGYPQSVIDRIEINPSNPSPNSIPIYLEQRVQKEIAGWTVTGKFDFIGGGILSDHKSTSSYVYTSDKKAQDYQMQGSIYRWLNPEKVTKDYMEINFLINDWKKVDSYKDGYPKARIVTERFPLIPIQQVEVLLTDKLNELDYYKDLPEEVLPQCNPKELWQKPDVFKYYKSGQVSSRSTANFDNEYDALNRKLSDGDVGIVVKKPGQAMACKYCAAAPLCSQFATLKSLGLIAE